MTLPPTTPMQSATGANDLTYPGALPSAPRHAADTGGTSSANPAKFAKAIGAAVLAGLGVLYVALSDNQVSAQEWVGVAQAAAAAGAVVYGIPNKGA